ncbi:hypothetical protein CWI36_2269p0010 [Hamiltosporidium magnivora]|uniref:Uncharacterized protein n=1 Tax=Hamiltosporidium magnivora TaxID=148818 RepID=A0A4Q9KVR7_9MICR|nr:hypothetical protein CWI36_2269p0010 [Hamiltosporidium magnivora]
MGKVSTQNDTNKNGVRLIQFATSRNIVISSKCFINKGIHRATWKSLDNHTVDQIDQAIVDTGHALCMQDVKAYADQTPARITTLKF